MAARDQEKEPLLGERRADGAGSSNGNNTNPSVNTTQPHVSFLSPKAEEEERPPSISNTQAMMHLMKGMIGTGILAIPSAIKNAGLWVGCIGLLFFGVICIHCMLLLVKSSRELSRRSGKRSLDYPGVVREAFSNGPQRFRKFTKFAVISLNIFLCMTQYGFCCVYILFIGDNIRQVAVEKGGFNQFPVQFYSAMATILLMLVMVIRTLKRLAPISMLANVLCLVGLIIILQYCVRGLKPIDTYPAFASWSTLPLYFGTAVYAFEGIGVVLPIENRMRTPEDYPGLTGVLNTGMVIVTCLYTAVGFFGYMKTGGISGSITLDLPNDDWLYVSVNIIFSAAIFCTFPLQFFVSHGIIWPSVKLMLSRCINNITYLHEYLFKVGIVLITFILAAVIPHLDLMISLVGALASTGIAIIFPVIMDVIIFYPEGELAKWEIVKNIFLMIFALLGLVAGTTTAIVNIIQKF